VLPWNPYFLYKKKVKGGEVKVEYLNKYAGPFEVNSEAFRFFFLQLGQEQNVRW